MNQPEECKIEQASAETQTDLEITKPPTASKSVSTIPIQIANKAVNTRTRVIHTQKPHQNSLQFSNGSSNGIDIQPITSSENKIVYVSADKLILSPTTRRRSSTCERSRICDTTELIFTASEILTEFISNAHLEEDGAATTVD